MTSLPKALQARTRGPVHDGTRVPAEWKSNFGHVFEAAPRLALEPANAEDVASAIRFAREHALSVSARGSGHSQSHVAINDGGVLLHMPSLRRIGALDLDSLTIDVEGGAVWGDVVRHLLPHGLAPPVLTNNLSVTVGGTLSTAGVGVASFRHGTQGDQVAEIDVVTGTGERVTCGPDRAPELFWAAIAGLGQCGVITRARLRLRRTRPMTRTYYLLYDDVATFMADAARAMADPRWDHLESWASPCPQGTKPLSGRRQVFAKWFFPFHLTVEFDPQSPPDDEAMLAGLSPYDNLYVDDIPTIDFFERMVPVFDLWKRGGTWEHVHPWMETVLPWERAPDMMEAILPDLPPSILVGGHVLLWPAKGSTSRSRLFMRPPGENLMGFGILPAVPPRFWSEARPMLENASRLSVAMGGKRYLSGYVEFAEADWREHYGAEWDFFAKAKRTYDPDGILNPGFIPLAPRAGAAARKP